MHVFQKGQVGLEEVHFSYSDVSARGDIQRPQSLTVLDYEAQGPGGIYERQ